MRISAKGEYAVKAMLDLALHYGKGLIPIQDIAERQAIPQRYLEQVLLLLKRAGFLQSKRGSAGGYHLMRPPQEISVGAVLRAMEGSLEQAGAGRRPGKRSASDHGSDLEELWGEISAAVSGVVDHISFGDLCRRAEQRRSALRPMYHI
ncbi:MAG: Rrf2 family transcriptional regulator [Candidatus Rokubacteria bacterium]|nr:Rrf2 family transcriptional regulator [Candidatus Rokubacteria bacterium]